MFFARDCVIRKRVKRPCIVCIVAGNVSEEYEREKLKRTIWTFGMSEA